MSSHRGHTTHNSTGADTEAMQRVRYMAHMERRARPPTFRPLTIIAVVLSIGLFIIGLIMIVIAHWPGVSGGDSLKIAGGVLMAVGAVVFIISMVITCVLRNRETERFEKSIASIAASRSNMSAISRPTMQTTPTPSVDAKPGKSILKKTPSTSTYGTNRGSVFGEESDTGIPNHYNSFGQSYDQDSDRSDTSAGKYEVYRIETLPDPSAAKRGHQGRNGSVPQGALTGQGMPGPGVVMEQSSTDSEAQVIPTAVRNTKKRRGQSPSVASGRHNPSYSPDTVEVPQQQHDAHHGTADRPGRTMQQYSQEGYDMYEADPTLAGQPPRKHRDEMDQAAERAAKDEKRRQRRAQRQAASAAANTSRDSADNLAGAGAGMLMGAGAGFPSNDQGGGFQNEAFAPQEADLGYPTPPPEVHRTVTTTTTRNVTRSTTRPTHDNSQNRLNTSQLSSSMGSHDELRINIKAQSGTAVHITPTGARKFAQQRTVASPSQSSVETEI